MKNTMLERITAIVFLIFVSVVIYYSFYPFDPVTLNSISIDKKTYCKGEWARVEMDFTKNMNTQAKVNWFIVDGIIYQLDSPGISRPVGDNNVIVSKQIPVSLLPGKYNLRVELEYDIHPFHPLINVAWDTPKFEVLDCEKL